MILRRRLMGDLDTVDPSKVSTPTIVPEGGTYSRPRTGVFDCTITCSEIGAALWWTLLDENGQEISSGYVPPPQSGQTTTTVNVCQGITTLTNYRRTLQAFATKVGMLNSDTAEEEYLFVQNPPGPEIKLYCSTTGDGNNVQLCDASSGNIYTPAYVSISPGQYASNLEIRYAINGADPYTSSVIYDSSVDKVQWNDSSQVWNNEIPVKYYIQSPGTYSVSAYTELNGRRSNLTTIQFTVRQSQISCSVVIHSDLDPNNSGAVHASYAGLYRSVDVDTGTTHRGEDRGIRVRSETFSSVLDAPDTYGFGFLVNDRNTSIERAVIRYSTMDSSSIPNKTISKNHWVDVNRYICLNYSIEKFGCQTVTGRTAICMFRIATKISVTQEDINTRRGVFLCRGYQWIDQTNKFGRNFAEEEDGARYQQDRTLRFAYDVEFSQSDYIYDDSILPVRIYVTGGSMSRFIDRSDDVSNNGVTMMKNIYTPVPGSYNPSNLHLVETTESMIVWYPTVPGDYDLMYYYPEYMNYKDFITTPVSGDYSEWWTPTNSPLGVLNSMFHKTSRPGVPFVLPSAVAVSRASSVISPFFMSNFKQYENPGTTVFFSDNQGTQPFVGIRVFLGAENISVIGDYAFSNTKFYDPVNYPNSKVPMHLDYMTNLETIGKYVFFGCTDSGSWTNANSSISEVHLPANLKKIGAFFCGFNSNSTSTVLPTIQTLELHSIFPPELSEGKQLNSMVVSDAYNSMACYVWTGEVGSANPFSIFCGEQNLPFGKVCVPDLYVCVYNDVWRYQLGTNPSGLDRKVLKFDPRTSSGNQVCIGTSSENIDYPIGGTPQGRFTYRDYIVDQWGHYQFGNKMCISKGNLVYDGVRTSWWFHDKPWNTRSEANNESTSSSSVRDLFAWGTSGVPNGSAKYRPWEFGGNNDSYRPYNSTLADLVWNGQTLADWGHNRIAKTESGPSASDWPIDYWRTPWVRELEYILSDRKTLYGYRFAKAKVNGAYGLILFPDNWNPSWYPGITNVNKANLARYSDNTISSTDWNTSLHPRGAVFLKACGRLNSNGSLIIEDNGWYWTSNRAADQSYARTLKFDGSYLATDPLIIDDIQKGQACSVRLVKGDIDYASIP